MNPNDFWEWSQSLLTGVGEFGSWAVSPLPVIGIAPLFLMTIGGLLVFLGFAVAKWFIS